MDSLDVSVLKELETLIVSHNQLSELSDLPNTLQVVKATYNKLEKLDLSLLDKLQVLHISNNMITLIENMQENIDDFQM